MSDDGMVVTTRASGDEHRSISSALSFGKALASWRTSQAEAPRR